MISLGETLVSLPEKRVVRSLFLTKANLTQLLSPARNGKTTRQSSGRPKPCVEQTTLNPKPLGIPMVPNLTLLLSGAPGHALNLPTALTCLVFHLEDLAA